MLGLYLFAAVVGTGLLAFSLGDDASGHGHDIPHGGIAHAHAGDVLLGFFRPRNIIFFLAAFGLTGSLLTWAGTARVFTALAALAMGLGAMAMTQVVFRWLRTSDSAVDVVGDVVLEGSVARVVLPVGPDARGRIACSVGGREVHVVARLAPGVAAQLQPGGEVLVVRMVDGEAEIAPYGTNEIGNS